MADSARQKLWFHFQALPTKKTVNQHKFFFKHALGVLEKILNLLSIEDAVVIDSLKMPVIAMSEP